MSGRYPDSSPLLGDRHGLNEPIVRVGTSAAARQLPINEAAAAYSFSQRYPRLAKVVYHTSVAGSIALILASVAAFLGFWFSQKLTVLTLHKMGFGFDGVQQGTFADSLVHAGQAGNVDSSGGGADLQLWGYFVWPALGLLSALLAHRLALAAYRGIVRACESCERESPYAYSRVGDTHAHPVTNGGNAV